MSKLITASIDVTKIDKTRLITGKKGTYANLTIWVNDEADQFGNTVSIQQSLSKDERESGVDKIYLGNGKSPEKTAPAEMDGGEAEDMPF